MTEPTMFRLKWNKFTSNLSSAFLGLLEQGLLTDVTLVASAEEAEGQLKQIRAHRLVLAACSPYFKDLFMVSNIDLAPVTNPSEHPTVFLPNVKYSELNNVLLFMYKGELEIQQNDMMSFLNTAATLQVKGLTLHAECRTTIQNSEVNLPSTNPHDNFTDNNTMAMERTAHNINSSGSQNKEAKMVLQSSQNITVPSSKNSQLKEHDTEFFDKATPCMESVDHKDVKSEKLSCPHCPKRYFTNRYNLKIHIRDRHGIAKETLKCEICHKLMRNRSCLRVHMYHHRKTAVIFNAVPIVQSEYGDSGEIKLDSDYSTSVKYTCDQAIERACPTEN